MSIDPMIAEPGTWMFEFFKDLIQNAKDSGGKVRGVFNGTEIECYPDSTVRELDYLWLLRREENS